MSSSELNAIIKTRIDLTPSLAVFYVQPQGWQLPDFSPGQFAILGLPGDSPRLSVQEEAKPPKDFSKIIRRAYSIVSSPNQKKYLEFLITIVDEGSLTPRIWNLKEEDSIYLGPKITGHFTLDDAPQDKHTVFIATGTGIAPYISMVRTYYQKDQKRKFAIFHGVRTSEDLAYSQELKNLSKNSDNFFYFPIISRPQLEQSNWSGATGHVQKLWEDQVLQKAWRTDINRNNTQFYLCGSPGMIEGMVDLLGKSGFNENRKGQPGQIFVERYW